VGLSVTPSSLVTALAVVSLDDVDVPEKKPHFLDYDAAPPPEYEEPGYGYSVAAGEQLKMDKKYERDGEISDYELAACGYTKKEFTQDDNTLHFNSNSQAGGGNVKPIKHFLDENPIPPDYMLAQELREHRSLDRNFERQSAQQQQLAERQTLASSASTTSSAASTRSSRCKEPSYTLSRFLDTDMPAPPPLAPRSAWTSTGQQLDASLGAKVECVYSLLSMLGQNDALEMSKKFLELSGNAQSCATLRRSGCMPLLVQMMHASDNEPEVRRCASQALHNVVHSHPDEKAGRREAKVLRLLDQIIDYGNFLKTLLQSGGEAIADDSERHPLAAISSLMKVSFDEEHRQAMCQLGALQVIPNLVQLDHAVHGPKPEDQCCNSLRRYALMALTNLTFGDEQNKALLCGQKQFMEALVAQLDITAADDLLQVTASVLRNLSWRADAHMKTVLNEIGTVGALAKAAMRNKSENTLKAILSALWNLSAHCSTNKAEFCAVPGALGFLVGMLSYEGPSKTLKIIENAGGILRNVSSHIAVHEPYRAILRQHNCLAILLQQLKSESLTVVSNACGTLWNLSARCAQDQKFLWDNGAVPMLRSLIHSKHAMISEGSSSALKNLLNFRPALQQAHPLDATARSMGLKQLPTLQARKQKALQQELGSDKLRLKSESRDSVYSAKSDTVYEHLQRQTQEAEEQPIDYAAKYSEGGKAKVAAAVAATTGSTYQETDLDQPTDFSLRYAEAAKTSDASTAPEILLLIEDSVKCYQTEDTPYVISNAASITDLRQVTAKTEPEQTPKLESPTKPNSALETPLMFSRRSSMDSLDVDVANCDEDKSSVVSDFSRLASGVISPSELPDSPTQSMPQSPRRISAPSSKPLRSVFTDELSSFHVEHTPAQFSNCTSLSNLSIVDEPKLEEQQSEHAKPPVLEEETTRSYCTEDTPALRSKLGSQSNLCSAAEDTEVSSNASDAGAHLLQQCIRVGMQQPAVAAAAAASASAAASIAVEDPIAMLRRGGNVLPAYLPVCDEMSKYLVEDSPCNFSVVSGLSNLTVGSSLVGPALQLQDTKVPEHAAKAVAAPPAEAAVAAWQDDSLSSLSIDSEDDTNLLSQAIAAGCNRPKSNLGYSSKRSSSLSKLEMPLEPMTSNQRASTVGAARKQQTQTQQDYYSSVDSSDSNDNQSKSLFELCILNGMYKSKEPTRQGLQQHKEQQQFDSLPVQLPAQSVGKRQRSHHHHHHHHQQQQQHPHQRERERKDEKLLQECINTGITKKLNQAVPKNGPATSAAALEQSHPMAATTSAGNSASSTAAPDVEPKSHQQQQQPQEQQQQQELFPLNDAKDIDVAAVDESPAPSRVSTPTLSDIGSKDSQSSDESNQSFILQLDAVQQQQSQQASSQTDKHKDPDLMLKSVERLTLEFVTSAEQLRTNSNSHSQSHSHSHCQSNTNHTWTEHSCPNDVSFPSVSQSPPILAELSVDDDVTEADYSEMTATPTQRSSLNFELGGAVRSSEQAAARPLLFNGTSASILSQSTLIAYEAQVLAEQLEQEQHDEPLTFSINNSLDLDQVRPPSGMESLNSACNTQPSSLRLPSKSPRFARKALPAALLARRALGQLAGSAESINSSCNLLDNIKPPSLMDELLDSMLSVESIQSELADGSLATTISVSNYETAACEDNTLLQSCQDEEDFEEDATMNEDFSSAESTPKQSSTPSPGGRRTLTPREKRRLAKERYKTYTISSNETLQLELVATEQELPLDMPTTPRQNRRRGSAERYKTQLIECPRELLQQDMRAMMQQFTYISDIDIGQPEQLQQAVQEPVTEARQATPPPPPTPPSPAKLPEAAVKVVRGRKKPAYVSPYSMQSQRSSSAAAAAASAANKQKTLSPTIAKRSVLTAQRLPLKKKPAAQSKPAAPSAPAPAPRLERQGTFVKDEPTNSNVQVPIVEAISPTKATPTSKLPTKRTTAVKSANASPKRSLPPQQQQRANTSIRIASAKAAAASRVAAQSARVSATTPPSRSNSNLSGGSAAAKINQAQSRIANIWKRVDEVKGKSKTTPNVTASKSSKVNAKPKPLANKTNSTQALNAAPAPLLRSSTFDNTPPVGISKSKLPMRK
ncbi:Apc, partial [Drosophila busckii]